MKLIGYADGVEVLFDFYPPDTFKAEIPKKLNGIYIIELHAVDDAGNKNNYTNMIIAVDFNKLTFNILKQNYISNENKDSFKHLKRRQDYKTEVVETFYNYKSLQSEFVFKELVI